MGNIPYIDILILAMIAVFILNRLKNVLGKKTGNETNIVEKFNLRNDRYKESKPDKTLKNNIEKKNNENLIFFHKNANFNKILNEITKFEKSFNLDQFLDNAKKAFEYIINAYSANNFKLLEGLLDKTLYQEYKKDIDLRLNKKEKLEITLIGLKDPSLIDVKMKKIKKENVAEISLEYSSEQIHVLKNHNDEVVDGDTNQILDIKENWTFIRKLNSKNPNWTLLKISETK